VGALNGYLAKLLASRLYNTVRRGGKEVLSRVPPMKELAKRWEEHMKGMVLPGTLFEEFGFNYIGPIDGHDVAALVVTLGNMRTLPGPQFLHIVTQKGKGYAPAEADPIKWHGPGPYDPASGVLFMEKGAGPTYSQVFGEWLCDMAEQDSRFVAITPAMREGSGLVGFEKRFPERYFDVGIAEQHAVTLAAGLACDGLRPVVAIYSTFLQRSYDQLIHDVALQRLPVVFAIDRAGLVGGDGATHQGVFDLTYLRCVPNLVVMAPADENECRQMLYTAGLLDQPSAVRYPRGRGAGVPVETTMRALTVGRADIRRRGASGLALLAFGPMVDAAGPAADSLDATLVNMRFVKPIDEALLAELAASHRAIVTLEENAVAGGAGSAVLEVLQRIGSSIPVLQIGVPDGFVEHGSRDDNLATAGLDAAAVRGTIERFWRGQGIARAAPAG
jgi:1-deoxy-D-xylulose-5-phosphate synthase